MLNQEHDQIDEVKDNINDNVFDAKDEIIEELEKTKNEVLDCMKENVDYIKMELEEHMDKLFESFQGKINQQLQLQQKVTQKNIKDEIGSIQDINIHNLS